MTKLKSAVLCVTFCDVMGAAFAVLCLAAQESSPALETIEFVISDTYGSPIKSADVAIYAQGRNEALCRLKTSGTCRLPVGSYRLEGTASMQEGLKREFEIKSGDSMVLVAFNRHYYGHSNVYRPTARGSIKNLIACPGRTWMRVLSLRSSAAMDVAIEKPGNFELRRIALGDYAVIGFCNLAPVGIDQLRITVDKAYYEVEWHPFPALRD